MKKHEAYSKGVEFAPLVVWSFAYISGDNAKRKNYERESYISTPQVPRYRWEFISTCMIEEKRLIEGENIMKYTSTLKGDNQVLFILFNNNTHEYWDLNEYTATFESSDDSCHFTHILIENNNDDTDKKRLLFSTIEDYTIASHLPNESALSAIPEWFEKRIADYDSTYKKFKKNRILSNYCKADVKATQEIYKKMEEDNMNEKYIDGTRMRTSPKHPVFNIVVKDKRNNITKNYHNCTEYNNSFYGDQVTAEFTDDSGMWHCYNLTNYEVLITAPEIKEFIVKTDDVRLLCKRAYDSYVAVKNGNITKDIEYINYGNQCAAQLISRDWIEERCGMEVKNEWLSFDICMNEGEEHYVVVCNFPKAITNRVGRKVKIIGVGWYNKK